VELLDLYPTLVELCGLELPAGLEGVSLVQTLEDPQQAVKSAALTQTPRPNYPRGRIPEIMGYSMRTELYRYIEWRDFESKEVVARELYDHTQDPTESRNVVDQEQYRSEIESLRRKLDGLVSATEPSH
jgi:iduronate 2-sulfatase